MTDETPVSDIEIAPGWTASTNRAELRYGQAVYVAARCRHGSNVAHSIEEAVGCGLLAAVRGARGHTQADAAREMQVSLNAVQQWEQGLRAPRGLYQQALLRYLNSPTGAPNDS